MNVQGIGIPFKDQVRFESFRSKKGKNKALYLNYLELERDFSNRVSKYQIELNTCLVGLSKEKTEFIKKQHNIDRIKESINRARRKEKYDFKNCDVDESPRYPGEKRTLFPPVVSRSLTALDQEQYYELLEEPKVDEESEEETEPPEEVDFFDRIPEKLYDDSRKSVNKRVADDAEKTLKLDHTRVYIERSNSIFIGMPDGSVDERGISKRLIVPALLKRWKKNATQLEMKQKRRSDPRFGDKAYLEKLRSKSRSNLLAKKEAPEEGKESQEKKLPFHIRMLMPINEEEGHEGKMGPAGKNPLVTRSVRYTNKNSSESEERSVRPQAARAHSREARSDRNLKAIDAVVEETGKMSISQD